MRGVWKEDRPERRIECEDDKGRRYVVVVTREVRELKLGGEVHRYDGQRKYILADAPWRHITPIEGADTFQILDDETILRPVSQP